MVAQILALLASIFGSIPILDKWFRKSPIEKEKKEKQKVDEEHQENKETRRPSGDFWKDHHL